MKLFKKKKSCCCAENCTPENMQQAENKKQIVQHEQEQYFMVAGIEEKVQQSLQSLLSIYRSLNVDILKSRCFLEMIPSKAELLFVRIHAGFDA